MNLSDYLLSLIRTHTPILIGAVLTWAARKWGVGLPEDLSAQAAIFATGLIVAVYYAAARALEMKWPLFGKLLGASKPPAYAPAEAGKK